MNINTYVSRALSEDIPGKDVTTQLLVPPRARARAQIIAREAGVLCGADIAKAVFRKLDSGLRFTKKISDGKTLKKGAVIAELKGKTRALLSGERVALNFLGYLSGIATNTRRYVGQLKGNKARIFDTRKTTPGLRELEKYAVRCGGGHNHRLSLSEMVFIKDNHRLIMNGRDLKEAVRQAHRSRKGAVELEVDTVKEFKEALKAGADIILLDNMTVARMRRCKQLRDAFKGKKPLLEASGGITLKNVGPISKLGVDRISVGALTHSIKALDVSLEIIV